MERAEDGLRTVDVEESGSDSDVSTVDHTVVDEMLRLTVRQRLEQNDRMAALAARLQASFQRREGRRERDG